MNTLQIRVRQGRPDDLVDLQTLFVETISTVCSKDYNQDQIRAWTSSIENKTRWRDILANQYVLIAEDQSKIVGFCSLDMNNYIDLLYVHKDYQRQGIADRLYAGIEQEAKRQGQTVLTADVSKTARPFFEKMGFKILSEQTVVRNNVELKNYKMKKALVI